MSDKKVNARPRSKKLADGLQQAVEKTSVVRPFARILIADDFRVEEGGKVFAIGLFTDNVIVSLVPRGTPAPTAELPYGIDALAILLCVGGVSGLHDLSVTLGDGPSRQWQVDLQEGASANLIMKLRPLLVRSFGMKPVRIEFAGQTFESAFELRRVEVDADNGGRPQLPIVGARLVERQPAISEGPPPALPIGDPKRGPKRRVSPQV